MPGNPATGHGQAARQANPAASLQASRANQPDTSRTARTACSTCSGVFIRLGASRA